MLTEDNLKYLQTISDTELAHIVAFDPVAQATAQKIKAELHEALPDARVIYFGSSALGIAGENDIDLGVIDASEHGSNGKVLRGLYGEPIKIDEKSHKLRWEFRRGGFVVEMFLTNVLVGKSLQHIKNHERLIEDKNLQKAYEELKLSCLGLSRREYMKKKLEFFSELE
ncbi:MAG: GrpB family protein [Patescibacteria group bacterium]